MVPDIETRLKAMIRSMQEVVIPSIDSNKNLALDQANIILANLHLLMDQYNLQLHFEQAELRDYGHFLKELISINKDNNADNTTANNMLNEINAVIEMDIPLPEELNGLLVAIKDAVDNIA